MNTIIEIELKAKGEKTYMCFVDLEKAFDLLDREALWGKLQTLGISTKTLKLLRTLYEKVGLRISLGEKESQRVFSPLKE